MANTFKEMQAELRSRRNSADLGPPAPPPKGVRPPLTIDPPKPISIKELLIPLLLAQGVDLLTTENLLSLPRQQIGNGRFVEGGERNPLPGMGASGAGGSLARLGYGGLEALLVGLLAKKSPEAGKVVRNSLLTKHTNLGLHNQKLRETLDKMDTGQHFPAVWDPPLFSINFTSGGS